MASTGDSRTQARGRVRRELLVQAAKDLLAAREFEDISLADIAERAGIPTGSAYHFYPSVTAVFMDLTTRFGVELDEAIDKPIELPPDANWPDVVDVLIDRGAEFYGEQPAYRKLIISGKTPAEIKLADRQHDRAAGSLVIEAIRNHFQMHDFPRMEEVFFYMVEFVDLVYMISVQHCDEITDEHLVEAKRVARAYLRTYLPAELPPLSTS